MGVANTSLQLLSSEAGSLLDQAKKYREEMDRLEPSDPRREVYAKIIKDLASRSEKLSREVIATARSS